MTDHDYTSYELADARARLIRAVRVEPMVACLREALPALDRELAETVLARIPAFRASGNPDVLAQLGEHGPRHGREILRLLEGGAVAPFDFVHAHARLRAEQRFPLDAMLHAYRCGHRVTSRWLLSALQRTEPTASAEAGQALADFALAYTDAISTVASHAYAGRVRELTEAAVDRRTALMNLLLEGYDEADARLAGMLRAAGLHDDKLDYCVVAAVPVERAEMANPERARRLADALETLVSNDGIRALTDVRDDIVAAICFAPRRASGFSMPSPPLAPRLSRALAGAGPSVLIGIGDAVPASARIPGAYRQARIALELADVGRRVVAIADLPLPMLAVHLAGEPLRELLPAWSERLRAADTDAGGALSASLMAYAAADMNAMKAAARLAIHPNTLTARLARIRELTGMDPRRYQPLGEMLVAIQCWPAGIGYRAAARADA
ncbi:MAG: helix-turn-helix domain-containing protein [Burkholderiaceae bacterium]